MIKDLFSRLMGSKNKPSQNSPAPPRPRVTVADLPNGQPTYVWPDCAPPAPGEVGGTYTNGRAHYRKKEVSHGHWQWVVDEKIMEYIREREQQKADLRWGLVSRVLTDEEMISVQNFGYFLFVDDNVGFHEEEKRRIFNDALAQQFKLRTIAAQYKSE